MYFLCRYALIVGSLGLVAGLYACGGGSGSPVSTIDNRTGTGGTSEETGTGGATEETGTGGTSEETGTGGTSEETGTSGTSEETGTSGTSEETGTGGGVEMPDTETVEPAGPRYTPENAPFLGRPTQGPTLPPTRLQDFMHTTIVRSANGTYINVGTPGYPHIIGHRDEQLAWLENRGDVFVSYGTINGGARKFDVIGYLLNFESPSRPGVSTFATPPTIELAAGTPPEYMGYMAAVVQQLNAALPHDKRLHLSATPAPARSGTVPTGKIYVDFIDSNWPSRFPAEHLGTTTGDQHTAPKTSAHVWLNVQRIRQAAADLGAFVPAVTFERAMLDILAHEMLHALGLDGGHVSYDTFPLSIMNNSPIPTLFGTKDNWDGRLLYEIDREGLTAAYGRLPPGTSALDLGDWSNTMLHIRGDIVIEAPGRVVHFGAVQRNGVTEPWVVGPIPKTNLGQHTAMDEAVGWKGRLLGFTPSAEVVEGDAVLEVDLSSLNGWLEFSDMESWPANVRPGAAGGGTQWGDGDLSYSIEVRGNTFIQTGGDAGVVTGVFMGQEHQAMGGSLERTDLSAAFAGTR